MKEEIEVAAVVALIMVVIQGVKTPDFIIILINKNYH